MRNISLSVVDNDHSAASVKLLNKITSSNYFLLKNYSTTYTSALKSIEDDESDLIIEIPKDFEKNLVKEDQAKIMITANAISGQTAGLAVAYSNSIIKDFNNEIRVEWVQAPRLNPMPLIDVQSANWFNPLLNYKYYMVPGILAILVTMVGFFLSSLNIVREKEIGTIEQINVTPVKKYQFILAKLIPFWTLGLLVLSIGMGISWVIYGIMPVGNPLIIYAFASLYLIALLGFGLFTSTFAETQQQAMFIAYFFMTTFILLGGLFAAIENMPDWAQYITYFNPISYFIDMLRMVVLKGSTFADLKNHFIVITAFAIGLNILAILNYKKTT
jgi:ABC-2 type transport system permease protein